MTVPSLAMILPPEVTCIVDSSSLDVDSEGGIECTIACSASSAVLSASGSAWWAGVSSLRIDRNRTPEELDPLVVQLVAASHMDRLRSLTGLSWPAFSKLCKLDNSLPLAFVGFYWGPGEHVLRRLKTTTALPDLKRLLVKLRPLDRRVGDLFSLMAQWGRPLQELVIETSHRLAQPFAVTVRVSGDPSAPTLNVTGPGTAAELDWLCGQLGLQTTETR